MADLKISQLTSATTPLSGTEVLPIVQSGTTKQVSVADLTAGRNVAAKSATLTQTTVGSGGFKIAAEVLATDYPATRFLNTTANDGFLLGWDTDHVAIATNTTSGLAGTERVAIYKTSGDVKLNTGNLIQGTAAKGINFTANTPAAGMTSRLLNWYEQGTFTPAAVGGTTPGTGTYTTQVGRYTRIGNRVMFNINLNWSSHTGSGDMTISGLPFTSNSTSGNAHSVSIFYTGFSTLQANNVLVPLINANSAVITMYQTPAGGGTAGLVTLDTSAQVVISGHYEV